MSHFQHLICYLYSLGNKIYVYEICKLLHSFFIHNLYSVPTFLESGLYFIIQYLFVFNIIIIILLLKSLFKKINTEGELKDTPDSTNIVYLIKTKL